MSQGVDSFLRQAVSQGVFPGVAAIAGTSKQTLYAGAFGTLASDDPRGVTLETIFDVASLTKVMVTGMLFAQCVARKSLDLDEKSEKYLPQCPGEFTIRELLCHASGLAAWKPFYQRFASPSESPQARAQIISWIAAEGREAAPRKKAVYSDLGFMLLGFILEDHFGETLDALSKRQIFGPLQLTKTAYGPCGSANVAATENCTWRGQLLRGIVHDQNAGALGGIAGHAGVFSTAPEVAKFAQAILKNLSGEEILVAPETLREFCRRQHLPEDSTWALSWDTPSTVGSSAGEKWPKTGIGHLGYTGCSLWLDPQADFFVVCLSNRVNPTAKNEKMKPFRPQFHDLLRSTFRL